MKTNNKHRANRWERESAKMLSLWVSKGKRKDIFWRTNSSGAKGTITRERNHCGDIVACDPAGAMFTESFHIEAKWKKTFDYGDIKTLKKWISVEGRKAKMLEKSLLMLIRGRCGAVYIMTNTKTSKDNRWNIPVPTGDYLFFEGYVIYRAPSSMATKKKVVSRGNMENKLRDAA